MLKMTATRNETKLVLYSMIFLSFMYSYYS